MKIGINLLTKEGGYFTSNSKKLFSCIENHISCVEWKDVLDVTVKGKNDFATIIISVRNTNIINNNPNIPNTTSIIMYGIKNGIMIAETCKRRMSESRQMN